ncbi:MAG TPA: hypothetical protein VJ853_13835 [Thermoanaerobaculia bacterium]|nr:hypothetical protein [Thermoanaerobaculia bacterium]
MRSTTEVLRRGFDSTVANWPLILIRIAESIVFLMIIIGSVVAAIVPIAVAAGLSSFNLRDTDNPGEAIVNQIVDHWMLIVYILAIITIVITFLIALHAFVEAGNAQVFVDAERAGAGKVFSIDRWLYGGRSAWWSIFWIYNVAWGIAGLILLIPLLITMIGMLIVNDAAPRVAVACGGLGLTALLLIPIGVIVAIWTQKAIAVAVASAASATAALKNGWAQIRADLGRHLAVAFIVFAIAFGGSMVISTFTMPMSMLRSMSHTPAPFDIAFAPAQIVSSFLQSIFSAAVGLWFLASYVGMTEER